MTHLELAIWLKYLSFVIAIIAMIRALRYLFTNAKTYNADYNNFIRAGILTFVALVLVLMGKAW